MDLTYFLNDPYRIGHINIALCIIITGIILAYRYVFPKKNIHIFLILLIVSFIPTISLFREGTYQSGDLRVHVSHTMEFYGNLTEGNYLPQWTGNLCGGYGCPIFIIEYLLPYYVASFFHFLGFSILTSLKLVLALSFITSGLSMYIWARKELSQIAAFVAAIFYLFAPFHLIDLHFRGSIGEVMSFALIPLLFLVTKNLIEKVKIHYFFLISIVTILLLLTHSSTTLIATPLALGYGFCVWIRKKPRSYFELLLLVGAVVYGMLLSTIYWLPAMKEIEFTWWRFVTYGDFKPFWEYIYSPAKFGFLFQGNHGEYRLIIGYFHLAAVFTAIYFLRKKQISPRLQYILIYFLLAFFALFFMMLSISEPIWQAIPILKSFIMVWRLLVPLAFVTAVIAGIIAKDIKNNTLIAIICYFTITSTVLNWANRKMVPIVENPIIRENEIYTEYYQEGNPIYPKRMLTRNPIKDQIVLQRPSKSIDFISGSGSFVQLAKKHTVHEYVIATETNAIIRENTRYFPGWKVFANNKELPINYENSTNNSFGIITFALPKGLYKIEVKFIDSPMRALAKNITIWSFVVGMCGIIVHLIHKKFRMNHIYGRKKRK